MGRRSSIELLPPEVKEAYLRLAQDGRLGAREIAAHLATLGVGVSKSAVDRDLQRRKVVNERLRLARETAASIVQNMKDPQDEDYERATQELLQAGLLEFSQTIAERGKTDASTLLEATMAQDKLASAKKKNVETFALRQKIRAQAAKDAAAAADQVCGELGLSDDVVQKIRSRVLGIAAP